MRARHADRLWIIGGVVAAALLIAVGWFVAINPQRAAADGYRAQQETIETQLVVLRRRLADLEEEHKKLPQYRATLKRDKEALPDDSGVPDFLRQLQDSGDLVGVTVNGVAVNSPEQVTGTGTFSLPITVTAQGTATKLDRFLDQLQQVQPRAVLIQSANLAAAGDAGTETAGSGQLIMTLAIKTFVATDAGAPAAAATVTPPN
jgi:Tfp pilus assembly protein PilO